eukprot:2719577-Pleurochrysis_carterae.AAC.3
MSSRAAAATSELPLAPLVASSCGIRSSASSSSLSPIERPIACTILSTSLLLRLASSSDMIICRAAVHTIRSSSDGLLAASFEARSVEASAVAACDGASRKSGCTRGLRATTRARAAATYCLGDADASSSSFSASRMPRSAAQYLINSYPRLLSLWTLPCRAMCGRRPQAHVRLNGSCPGTRVSDAASCSIDGGSSACRYSSSK